VRRGSRKVSRGNIEYALFQDMKFTTAVVQKSVRIASAGTEFVLTICIFVSLPYSLRIKVSVYLISYWQRGAEKEQYRYHRWILIL
jgi:hypothetical protein